MISQTVTLNTAALDAQAEAARVSPALMASGMKVLVRRERARLRKDVSKTPPQSSLPFIWSLDLAAQGRARRWYFANKVPKGSKGGRYKRTGKLAEAWELRTQIDQRGGVIVIENKAPGAAYVYGPKQVPSHSAWINKDKLAAQSSERISRDGASLWLAISDPTQGAKRR